MLRKTLKYLLYFIITIIIIIYIVAYTATYFIKINDYKSEIENNLNNLDKGTFQLKGDLNWVRFPSVGIKIEDINYTSNDKIPVDAKFSSKNIVLGVNLLYLMVAEVNISKILFDNITLDVVVPDKLLEGEKKPAEPKAPEVPIVKDQPKSKLSFPLHKNPVGPWARLSISDYAIRDLDISVKVKGKTYVVNNLSLEVSGLRLSELITLDKFAFRVNEVDAGGILIKNISSDIKITSSKLILDNVKFDFLSSRFNLDITSELNDENLKWSVAAKIENLDLDEVSKELKIKLPVTGIINTNTEISSRGIDPQQIVNNLSIEGKFSTKDLVVNKEMELGDINAKYEFKDKVLFLDPLELPLINAKTNFKIELKDIDLNDLDKVIWNGSYDLYLDFDKIAAVIKKPDLIKGNLVVNVKFNGQGSSEKKVLDTLYMNGKIKSAAIYLVQKPIKSLDTDIKFENKKGLLDIDLKPIGGDFRFITTVDFKDAKSYEIKSIFKIENIDINPYIRILSSFAETQGLLNLKIALRTSGDNPKKMIENLDGSFDFNIDKFFMKDTKLSQMLMGSSGGSFGKASTDITGLFSSNTFRNFTINAVIEKGVFQDDFQMLGDNFDMIGKGSVDFAKQKFVDKYKIFLIQKERGFITSGPKEMPIPLIECGGSFSNVLCIPSPDSELFPCGKKPKQDGGSNRTRSMVF